MADRVNSTILITIERTVPRQRKKTKLALPVPLSTHCISISGVPIQVTMSTGTIYCKCRMRVTFASCEMKQQVTNTKSAQQLSVRHTNRIIASITNA